VSYPYLTRRRRRLAGAREVWITLLANQKNKRKKVIHSPHTPAPYGLVCGLWITFFNSSHSLSNIYLILFIGGIRCLFRVPRCLQKGPDKEKTVKDRAKTKMKATRQMVSCHRFMKSGTILFKKCGF